MTARITVHLSDAARGEVARRVDAGDAPSMSAWAAAAVERALDGGAPVDPGEEVALREQIAALQGEQIAALAARDAEETRRRTAEEERDAVWTQLHAAEVRLAASEARCEERANTVSIAVAYLAEAKDARDKLQEEKAAALEIGDRSPGKIRTKLREIGKKLGGGGLA